MDLVDPFHLIFDGVFNRDDLAIGNIDPLESAVKSRALATACWSRHEENPVRLGCHLANLLVKIFRETDSAKVDKRSVGPVKDTHDDAFTVHRWKSRNTKVDFFPEHLEFDAAILRQTSFRNIQLRHQFNSRNDRRSQRIRRGIHVVQHAIHAVAQAQIFLERFDMNIACS